MDDILRLYDSGLTIQQVAEHLGIGWKAARNAIRRHPDFRGFRSPGPASGVPLLHTRQHTLNTKFFAGQLDTEPKAYWAGFLAADGCVTERGAIQVILQAADADHLRAFAAALESSRRVRIAANNGSGFGGGPRAILTIWSVEMVHDLIRHGVTPRKSATCQPARTVAPGMEAHYWRGVVDGDGHLHGRSAPRQLRVVGLSGTPEMLTGFRDFLQRAGIETHARIQKGRTVHSFAVGGNGMAVDVAHILYGQATIALGRKMALYKSWL